MDPATAVQIISLVFVILASSIASYMDLRYRTVPDEYWFAIGFMGPIGFFLYWVIGNGLSWGSVSVLSACILMTFFVLTDNDLTTLFGLSSAAISIVSLLMSSDAFTVFGSVSVLFGFLYVALYYLGVIRGGADAKFLITVGMSFPCYTGLLGQGLSGVSGIIFSPSLSVLYLGAIFAVVYCVGFFTWVNRGCKGLGVRRFVSGSMPLQDAKRSFVWIAADVENGKLKSVRGYSDDQDELYQRLEEYGIEEVPVTPMVPFILPMTLALVFIVVFGNPFGLLGH